MVWTVCGLDIQWSGQSVVWTFSGLDSQWSGHSVVWTVCGLDIQWSKKKCFSIALGHTLVVLEMH